MNIDHAKQVLRDVASREMHGAVLEALDVVLTRLDASETELARMTEHHNAMANVWTIERASQDERVDQQAELRAAAEDACSRAESLASWQATQIKTLEARATIDLPGMVSGFGYERSDVVDAERKKHRELEQELYDAGRRIEKERDRERDLRIGLEKHWDAWLTDESQRLLIDMGEVARAALLLSRNQTAANTVTRLQLLARYQATEIARLREEKK